MMGSRTSQLPKTITIGSSSDCDYCLSDPSVAHHHATIEEIRPGRWVITSTDPDRTTSVNGNELSVGMLPERCWITLGRQSVEWPASFLFLSQECSDHLESEGEFSCAGNGFSPEIEQIDIGSARGNQVYLDHPTVELKHASIVHTRAGWLVKDHQTATGTYQNGDPIQSVLVKNGDLLTFGGVTLEWPKDFLEFDSKQVIPKRLRWSTVSFNGVAIANQNVETIQLYADSIDLYAGGLYAVIGPSGIGKSTLCRAIMGEAGIRRGKLERLGQEMSSFESPIPSKVSFVPQQNFLLPELTVGDTLQFASRVRQAQTTPAVKKKDEIDRIINLLGLQDHINKPVSVLSGGQQKRLSIAVELFSKPQLLILDEPTSGLDEGLDRTIVKYLKAITEIEPYTTVIVVTHTTIHLDLFDQIIAIGAAMSPVYGEVASVRYFGRPDLLLSSMQVDNFADCMDCLRLAAGTSSVAVPRLLPSSKERPQLRSFRWSHHILPLLKREWKRSGLGDALSLYRHFSSQRRSVRVFSSLMPLFTMVFTAVFTSLAGDGLLSQVPGDNPKLLTTITVLVLLLCFWALYMPTMRLIQDWPITRREQRWGVSGRLHILARAVFDAPFVILVPAGTVWLSQFIEGFWGRSSDSPSRQLVFVAIVLVLACSASYCIGMLIGAATLRATTGIQVVILIASILLVMSGVIIPLKDHPYLDYAARLSPSRLSIATLASRLDVAQGRGTGEGLDPLFQVGNVVQCSMCGVLALIAAISLLLSLFMAKHTMARLDRP